MARIKSVTKDTPKNILFSVCTVHKNFDITTKDYAGTLVGATSGGVKFSIVPEYLDLEIDGVSVKVKGAKKKIGETGTVEINSLEFRKDILSSALAAAEGISDVEGYSLLETKSDIVDGDYWDNITVIGTLVDGRNAIVIMENALCTSGLEVDTKNKEAAIPTITFECHADIEDEDLDKLPIHIYYQDIVTTTTQ